MEKSYTQLLFAVNDSLETFISIKELLKNVLYNSEYLTVSNTRDAYNLLKLRYDIKDLIDDLDSDIQKTQEELLKAINKSISSSNLNSSYKLIIKWRTFLQYSKRGILFRRNYMEETNQIIRNLQNIGKIQIPTALYVDRPINKSMILKYEDDIVSIIQKAIKKYDETRPPNPESNILTILSMLNNMELNIKKDILQKMEELKVQQEQVFEELDMSDDDMDIMTEVREDQEDKSAKESHGELLAAILSLRAGLDEQLSKLQSADQFNRIINYFTELLDKNSDNINRVESQIQNLDERTILSNKYLVSMATALDEDSTALKSLTTNLINYTEQQNFNNSQFSSFIKSEIKQNMQENLIKFEKLYNDLEILYTNIADSSKNNKLAELITELKKSILDLSNIENAQTKYVESLVESISHNIELNNKDNIIKLVQYMEEYRNISLNTLKDTANEIQTNINTSGISHAAEFDKLSSKIIEEVENIIPKVQETNKYNSENIIDAITKQNKQLHTKDMKQITDLHSQILTRLQELYEIEEETAEQPTKKRKIV